MWNAGRFFASRDMNRNCFQASAALSLPGHVGKTQFIIILLPSTKRKEKKEPLLLFFSCFYLLILILTSLFFFPLSFYIQLFFGDRVKSIRRVQMIIPLGVPIVHYLRTSVSLSLFLSPTPAISLKMVKKGFIHTYIHIYIYIYI